MPPEVIGIVLAAVNSDYFERFYATLDVGRDGVVALWNKEQQLIARWPRRDDWVGRRLTQAGFVGAVDAGTQHSMLHGVATQGGVAPAVACTATNAGQKQVVKYQADYIIWKAAS